MGPLGLFFFPLQSKGRIPLGDSRMVRPLLPLPVLPLENSRLQSPIVSSACPDVCMNQSTESRPVSPSSVMASPDACPSPRNSIGSDEELLLLDKVIELEPLRVDRGCPESPPIYISPSSRSNVTVQHGKDRPNRGRKKSVSDLLYGIPDENFWDVPVSMEIGRVLRALTPTSELP